MRKYPHRKHIKYPGVVHSVGRPRGHRWEARIWVDKHEFYAEMLDPLPQHAIEGSLFWVHVTKRGNTYLYWVMTPWKRKDLKRARQEAKRLHKLFTEE